MEHVAILLAGGSGSRMAGMVDDKILVEIGSGTAFAHVLRSFEAARAHDGLVVVARDDAQRKKLKQIVKAEKLGMPVLFTLGGNERQDSVKAGLGMVPSGTKWITIHDCARPAVSPLALQTVRKTLLALDCAVSLAHRVTDTIRSFETDPVQAAAHGEILDRSKLWAMETPQAFPRDLLERAHEQLHNTVTDDIAAVEALGEPVVLVESTTPNPKLTRPSDLILLDTLLARQDMTHSINKQVRVGLGYDIHRLQKGIPLVLGGVRLPSDYGLVGHSDADVLSHAIADAILGACGLADIGHYFPNTDPEIAGISSQEILRRAVAEARRLGLQLSNIDATLIAERPRVAPYIARMKNTLAKTLGLDVEDIGIKATTQERIGSLGNGEGIAAHAVATLGGTRKREDQA
jgi:2-C-methyl-D-erythritol 2,4-cyclodiphosphate synthase/2-C-methyl-D-erythritol 4-phosphate cytidylyltransferase